MAEHSETAYLIIQGAPTGPEWDPQPAPPTEVPVVFVPTDFGILYRDQTLVQVGDVFGLISTETGYAPEMEKPIKIGGIIYQMKNVKRVRYRGATVLHKIQCRK